MISRWEVNGEDIAWDSIYYFVISISNEQTKLHKILRYDFSVENRIVVESDVFEPIIVLL